MLHSPRCVRSILFSHELVDVLLLLCLVPRSIRRSHAALAASVCAIDASSAHCLLTLAARSSSRWSWWKALAARLYSACAMLSLLPAARKALIDGGVSAADAAAVMGCDGSDAPSTGSAAVAITNW